MNATVCGRGAVCIVTSGLCIVMLGCESIVHPPATRQPFDATPILTLCELHQSWQVYHQRTVRVRAILVLGFEVSRLYDPDCGKETAIWAAFPDSGEPGVQGDVNKLRRTIRDDRRAWVTVDGVYHGPVPTYVDPRLPDWMKRRLEGVPQWYGHLGSYDAELRLVRIVDVKGVAGKVPWW